MQNLTTIKQALLSVCVIYWQGRVGLDLFTFYFILLMPDGTILICTELYWPFIFSNSSCPLCLSSLLCADFGHLYRVKVEKFIHCQVDLLPSSRERLLILTVYSFNWFSLFLNCFYRLDSLQWRFDFTFCRERLKWWERERIWLPAITSRSGTSY